MTDFQMKPSSVPNIPGVASELNIQWIVWGVIYVVLITILSHPNTVAFFPSGSWRVLLVAFPLWGITYMIRDAVQYSFENTAEKKAKSSGFWPSMVFVALAAVISFIYGDSAARIPTVTALVVAITVDGLVFSRLRHLNLTQRLLFSNIAAAFCDAPIFITLMLLMHDHLQLNMFRHVLTVFMEIFPALIVFILGSTLVAKALGLADFGIGRRINRGM